MKTLMLVLLGSLLLGACSNDEPKTAAEAGSFFPRPGGDVQVGGN